MLVVAACDTGPGGTPVRDKELRELLRPSRQINADDLVRMEDGRVYYIAYLADQPSSDLRDSYLRDLRKRGVTIETVASTPHVVPQRIDAYRITIVQEAALQPYTIRFKVAEERAGDRGIPSHPLSIRETRLMLRLAEGMLAPWIVRVVVPESDVAKPPLNVPLPAGTVTTIVREEAADKFINGRFVKPTLPTDLWITFLARGEPEEILGFFRHEMMAWSEIGKDEATTILFRGRRRPPWSPREIERLSVSLDSALFSEGPIALLRGADVSLPSLPNFPHDLARYQLSVRFRD